ncbi:MAG: 3-hydroxyacyl-CoA dehydrogenase/enoyl-CoA hydratase family protein, partial [Nitrospinota bacterium]
MKRHFTQVAVIGAGTMGAAIAAHVANAGIPVLLLDKVPDALTPAEEARGLTLESPAVRNRIVQEGFERARQRTPPAFMSPEAERLVTLGNIADDLGKIAQADWIIEAIVEQLEPKRTLMAQIEAVRRPDSIVTSNTSGLPIASLAAGRSDDFRRHFFGTHFFNPPRYMRLLEVTPTADSDRELVQAVAHFAETMLGKKVVFCKDTPNFIGNRLQSISGAFVLDYAFTHGYTIAEVDALTGPLIGRPRTAVFRLYDLVGIDVAAQVARNLYDLIPDDEYRHLLRSPAREKVINGLLERGWLGNKSGQGFYKRSRDAEGKRVFLVLNPETFDYETPEKPHFEAVEAVQGIPDLGQRLTALFDPRWQQDRGARFVWAIISFQLTYAAARAQEIAYDLKSIDDAIRWGFNHQLGPFELWDRLGVAPTVKRMEAEGLPVAPWVQEMLEAGYTSFYRVENGQKTGYYDWESKSYRDLTPPPRHLSIAPLRTAGKVVQQNESASIYDLDDGVLLLEFHSRLNTIDAPMLQMMRHARSLLEKEGYVGLVIGNEGEHFCAGANILAVATAAQQKRFAEIEEAITALQDLLMAFRYSPKPVVVAVHNRALGGGAEIVMHASRVVAHAESYIGLVETGVGLVPAGGGVKELVRRLISPAMQVQETDPLPLAQRVLETIGQAKVGRSAAESRSLGFLGPQDRIVMQRDHLLFAAKREVLNLVEEDYVPPPPARLYAGGRDLYAALKVGIWLMQQAGYLSEHDALIGEKLAYIIAGGDLSAPQWTDERYFLDLERQAFLDLVGTEKTQARLWHMLQTGEP